MALTYTEATRMVIGDRKMVITKVTFDSSYPTGGEAIAPSDVGLSQIDAIFSENGLGYQFVYDRTAAKIKVRTPVAAVAAHTHTGAAHTHTENTAASYTQNAVTASTTPGAGGTGGAITAAAGAEVADTTDLSSVSTLLQIFGR